MSDLSTAIQALAPDELRVVTRTCTDWATGMADRDRPRVAAVAHALAVELAEEADRRDDLLEELDPDRDEIGAIVPEPGEGGSNV